jgi:RimJ/RimL family protein N-acetyltransferase
MIDICSFHARHYDDLIATINAVCAERQWMETTSFELTPAWQHAFLKSDCACHKLLVAVHNSQCIGWCRAFPSQDRLAIELGVGLLAAYRDMGIGTNMVKQLIEWANAQKFQHIKITTRQDNQRAIHLFGMYGFVQIGEQDRWLRMILEINKHGDLYRA